MPRVKRGTINKKKHKKILKMAKGYRGAKSRSFRAANEQLLHSLAYSYRDRRTRKRQFRRLWISRINAAARENNLSYSQFISGLKAANIDINRKMLADMAVHDPESFHLLAEQAKQAR
jgi:large subunit ribosomal protein L20